ncbi:MAG: PAS domain S-box protein, partial [Deltaproteobacteria bacterium]|nr:PAS domain S-box protein [Deltaproteobacteria bacterium]
MSDGNLFREQFARGGGEPAPLISDLKSMEAQWVRAEEARFETERRLREIVRYMPVMIIVLDQNDRVQVWNQEAERVTGYSREEIMAVDRP